MSANILTELQDVFRNVFDDDSIELSETMTADDIPDWDSLGNINLIIGVEQCFGIKFATAEISMLKEKGQNVGSLVQLVASKKK
jgi:acyl carrier protein